MTLQEFGLAMAPLVAAIGKPMAQEQAAVYFDCLRDLPLHALQIAVKRVLLEHKYFTLPTIAEIRELAVSAITPPAIDATEALGLLRKAVRRFGYMQAAEGLASLPPLVRRVAAGIGWDAICESENPEALRAHFMRLYDQASTSERREGLLPEDLRRKIGESQKAIGGAVHRIAHAFKAE